MMIALVVVGVVVALCLIDTVRGILRDRRDEQAVEHHRSVLATLQAVSEAAAAESRADAGDVVRHLDPARLQRPPLDAPDGVTRRDDLDGDEQRWAS